MKISFVYIMTNASRRTLYTGITSGVGLRAFQHKHKVHKGFTAKYNVHRLVYYERYSDPWLAIAREKQIKGWLRAKKTGNRESLFSANPKAKPRSFARATPAEKHAGAPPSLRMTFHFWD